MNKMQRPGLMLLLADVARAAIIKRLTLFLLVSALSSFVAASAFAVVTVHAPYGISSSGRYTVKLNEHSAFVGAAGTYSFCTFDFDGSVTVSVSNSTSISSVKVLPTSLGITYTVSDNTIIFTLNQPEMLTVVVNNNLDTALHLFTSSPETNLPSSSDPNVIWCTGNQVCTKGSQPYTIPSNKVIPLDDNQTFYLASGARFNGMILVYGKTNVTIRGRGVIDGTGLTFSGSPIDGSQPWRLVYARNSSNIAVEGVTMYNSRNWTTHFHEVNGLAISNIRILNYSSSRTDDGMDLSSVQNATVSNSFIQTYDDCLAIKSRADSGLYYPNAYENNSDVKNVLIEGCTLANFGWGNGLEIGYELKCNNVTNITYRDCDIIRAAGRGAALSVHNTDKASVSSVLYDNIRIENANASGGIGCQLFNLGIFYSAFSYDQTQASGASSIGDWDNVRTGTWAYVNDWRGQIRNITYRNITLFDTGLPYSVCKGWTSSKTIDGVVFYNITANGTAITSAIALGLSTNAYATNISVNPYFYAAAPTSGLAPLSVQFNGPATDSGGNTITAWNWNFGDGATSTLQNPAHVYTTVSGFYPSLVVTNSLGQAITASGPSITTTLPTVQYSASPTNGFPPLNVQFTAPGVDTGGNAITSWNWDFGDGTTSTLQNPTHLYTTISNYVPLLVVTNSLGSPITASGPSIIVQFNSGLVNNGSFETGNLTSWAVTGDASYTGVSGSVFPPHSGKYEAILGTSTTALSYLSQTLTTTPGTSYVLSCWMNNAYGDAGNIFTISWNGTTLLAQTNPPAASWSNFQFVVTATSTSTVLRFGYVDSLQYYLGLDDISVLAVLPAAPPTITNFSVAGNDLVLNGSNGVSGHTYYVLTTTNLALPIIQWSPVATNVLNASGSFTITATNAVIPDVPESFYLLQTQ